jgi:hypothetical protein
MGDATDATLEGIPLEAYARNLENLRKSHLEGCFTYYLEILWMLGTGRQA